MQNLATADHTTLLLNCYAKLKDVDKLDAFIQRGGQDQDKVPSFDVETAYKVRSTVLGHCLRKKQPTCRM